MKDISKMILFKREDRYDLYNTDDQKVASSAPNPFGKLSKQNCDDLFGVIDVDKLAKENTGDIRAYSNYTKGFNKAMELNKNKLFTELDVEKMLLKMAQKCRGEKDLSFPDYVNNINKNTEIIIQSFKQPTEINVEIETVPALSNNGSVYYGDVPKLDSNGCIILKRI